MNVRTDHGFAHLRQTAPSRHHHFFRKREIISSKRIFLNRVLLILVCALAIDFSPAAFSATPNGHSGAPNSAFDDFIQNGKYREADIFSHREFAVVSTRPNFVNKKTRSAYLQAARNAQYWARWKISEKISNELDAGMQKLVPHSEVDWLALHARQITLNSATSNFKKADDAFTEGMRKANRHKLTHSREFGFLLAAQVDSLSQQQRNWETITLLIQEIAWLRKHEPNNAMDIGLALIDLGKLYMSFDYAGKSREYFIEAEQVLEPAYKSGKPSRLESVSAMAIWADVAYAVVDYKKWDRCKLKEERIKVIESELGPNSPELIRPLVDWASYCENELRQSVVEKIFERALKIARETWGEVHPDTAHVLEHQGTYYASREYSDALNEKGRKIHAHAAEIRNKVYKDMPLEIAVNSLYEIANDHPEECTYFSTGVCKARMMSNFSILEKAWGNAHPALAMLRLYVLTRIGGFSSSAESNSDSANRYAFVVEQCDTAYKSITKALGSDHMQVAYVAKECGEKMGNLDKFAKAEALLSNALKIYSKNLGSTHTETKSISDQIDIFRMRAKRLKEINGVTH